MRIRRVTAVVLAMNMWVLAPLAMATNVSVLVTDTVDNRRQGILETTFLDCRRQIFAVISLTNVPKGTHTLVVEWTDPNGRRRERNAQKILDSTREVVTWLKLHPATGSGVLRVFNPAVGMTAFIGTWNVVISLDGATMQRAEFEVVC
ncbi:MAG: hypothetical protein P8J24_05305 [Arenicellales bacterium]|nr:hypothetical protein [Arenicellales bacterium]